MEREPDSASGEADGLGLGLVSLVSPKTVEVWLLGLGEFLGVGFGEGDGDGDFIGVGVGLVAGVGVGEGVGLGDGEGLGVGVGSGGHEFEVSCLEGAPTCQVEPPSGTRLADWLSLGVEGTVLSGFP